MLCAKLYNSELPEDHDEDEEAEFCECRGGGRMFRKNGSTYKKWADLDKVYADKGTLKLIAQYESLTIAQGKALQKKNDAKRKREMKKAR